MADENLIHKHTIDFSKQVIVTSKILEKTKMQ